MSTTERHVDLASSLASSRIAAREEAEAELVVAGYRRDQNGDWIGELRVLQDSSVPIRVRLPDAFPDVLPEVHVERGNLVRRIAHHEQTGKICIAPTSGVLLDASRPKMLVAYALGRAAREVSRGLRGESDGELYSEFLAYWTSTTTDRTYSISDAKGATRVVIQGRLTGIGAIKDTNLIADSRRDAELWVKNLSGTIGGIRDAFFLRLASPFLPPEFEEQISLESFRLLVENHASAEDNSAFGAWLQDSELPATVIMSIPETDTENGRILVGVRIEAPTGESRMRNQKGFRPGHVPMVRTLALVRSAPVTRLNLIRVDREFLIHRGGATSGLSTKTVALIGAGAVGSEVALRLAALGIGHLRIIDPDWLGPENIHRHALGLSRLWQSKATSLAEMLASNYPHLEFEGRQAVVEEVLEDDPLFLTSADLAVFALGEETLERRLNGILVGVMPRLHTWVEPLGIGGHAFVCGIDPRGCYECLFRLDPEFGPINAASFSAPGQSIRRSLAGCAGTFSPFSATDAQRTAIEAANLVVRVLNGDTSNTLVSWRGVTAEFEHQGYRLSQRSLVVAPGQQVAVPGTDLARATCRVCGLTARVET